MYVTSILHKILKKTIDIFKDVMFKKIFAVLHSFKNV